MAAGVDRRALFAELPLEQLVQLAHRKRNRAPLLLPHGLAGGPHDADQPILLTTGGGVANRPVCVMAVDGAEVTPEELAGLERACILFDGLDGDAVQAARGQWKALTGAGCAAQYWSEESGRWEKKADSGEGPSGSG